MSAKRLIVLLLLKLCELHDRLRLDYITLSHRLADLSADLDERWNTGVWTVIK